ncbi:MAG: YciI family protein, partial [Arenicellales bacterium]|nr:YciI family protein [Arenicellales bacterium]
MLYAIIGHDVVNSLEHRQQARSQHLLRLEDLRDQGRLVLAGPFPSVDGIDPGPAGF